MFSLSVILFSLYMFVGILLGAIVLDVMIKEDKENTLEAEKSIVLFQMQQSLSLRAIYYGAFALGWLPALIYGILKGNTHE